MADHDPWLGRDRFAARREQLRQQARSGLAQERRERWRRRALTVAGVAAAAVLLAGVVQVVRAAVPEGDGIRSVMLTVEAGASPSPEPGDGPPYQAPPSYFATSPEEGLETFSDTTKWDPEQASLLGVHTRLLFDGMVTAAGLTPDQAAALAVPGTSPEVARAVHPATGHEFLVVRATEPPRERCASGSPAPAEFNLAAQVHSGELVYRLGRHLIDCRTDGMTLVVSVPVGEDVVLVVEEEGATQSLDLRTGSRLDEIEFFYERPSFDVTGSFDCWVEITTEDGTHLYAIQGGLGGVGLRPYVKPDGWAAPGRAWLTVLLDDWVLHYIGGLATFDTAAAFALVEPGGRTTAAEPHLIRVTDSTQGVGGFALFPTTVVFDVPETFRSGTVTFTPAGTLVPANAGDEYDTRSYQPGAITIQRID